MFTGGLAGGGTLRSGSWKGAMRGEIVVEGGARDGVEGWIPGVPLLLGGVGRDVTGGGATRGGGALFLGRDRSIGRS